MTHRIEARQALRRMLKEDFGGPISAHLLDLTSDTPTDSPETAKIVKGKGLPVEKSPERTLRVLVSDIHLTLKALARGTLDTQVVTKLMRAARGHLLPAGNASSYPSDSAFDAMIGYVKAGKATPAKVSIFLQGVVKALDPGESDRDPRPYATPGRQTRADGEK